jgi:hypothetical protein
MLVYSQSSMSWRLEMAVAMVLGSSLGDELKRPKHIQIHR